MLILTRKPGERIKIGDDVVVQVLEMSKGNVKLGIEAPRTVSVYRYEVLERLQQENIAAANGTATDMDKAVRMWRNKQQ